MSASPEKLGLKLLAALKVEKERSTSLLDCRTLSAIRADLKFTDAELNQAIRFLVPQGAIQTVDRADGKAALPSPQGIALLDANKQKTAWTLDRRIALYGVIAALISAVVGIIVWLAGR